jgi:aspartate racemase
LSRVEAPGDPFPLHCFHIAEVVADQAVCDGRRRIAVLGTNWTMQEPVYPGAFGCRRLGWEIPDGTDRKIIHDIIFEELCLGIFTDASRAAYVTTINKLAERGCDAVALVCTS